MDTLVLETGYVNQTRPYSLDELAYNRLSLYKSLRLGKMRVHHQKCDHFYLVRKNSKKETEMKEQNCNDVGNCSVCWKFGKTPKRLKDAAKDLINTYCNTFYEDPTCLRYDDSVIENSFYTWLYSPTQN